ncbi:hypothetical protein ACWGB8_26460 [Kitasatospora sp. NPDC054939]
MSLIVALEQPEESDLLRAASRYADAGDESALAHAALVYQEWQRIRGEVATTGRETYDQDHDLGLRRAQTVARHRQDVADRAREAAEDARQRTDTAHRRLAGAGADPLYTALARAGLHILTEGDHQAVRELTRHLDAATIRQVADWLERTRLHRPRPGRRPYSAHAARRTPQQLLTLRRAWCTGAVGHVGAPPPGNGVREERSDPVTPPGQDRSGAPPETLEQCLPPRGRVRAQ